MGYHIIYDASNLTKPAIRRGYMHILLMTGIFFAVFLILIRAFWVEGYTVFCRLFWGGNIEMLNEAAEYSLTALASGHSLPEAIHTFCIEKLREAQLIG